MVLVGLCYLCRPQPDNIYPLKSRSAILVKCNDMAASRGSVTEPFLIANQGAESYPIWMPTQKDELQFVARNRKARHDYEITETIEAGIELRGSEVKSIREGKINLSDAYALVEGGQVVLRNMNITPYRMATTEAIDPLRPRRLLLHKKEIRKLFVKTEQRGMSLIPLAVYFKGRVAKIELGLGIGRKKYDKRQVIAEAEAKRRIARATRKDQN